MGLEFKVSRALDNNNVQLDVKNKGQKTQYFAMPSSETDSFSTDYKKQLTKAKVISFGSTMLLALLGCVCANVLCSKMEQGFGKFLLMTLGGVLGCSAAPFLTNGYLQEQADQVMLKHKARQIFYDA